jgi:signal peptide peptidase-like protein 2B
MIDVASGSGNVRLRDSNYCEYHPKASECKHVSLPMVLSIPLIFSVYGGNALLGLGDIVIPGLLVSFCLRYDYCQGYPISRNYFCVASVSYSVGLLLANIMAITLRDIVAGQPALMYIVPSMLLSVLGVSICKGEYRDMWEGPECFNDDQIHICDLPESETEPFLRK